MASQSKFRFNGVLYIFFNSNCLNSDLIYSGRMKAEVRNKLHPDERS